MLNSQAYAGTRYTVTVAMIVIACVVSPALLLLSRPWGYLGPSVALACSGFCIALALVHWKKYSELTVSSIVTARPGSK